MATKSDIAALPAEPAAGGTFPMLVLIAGWLIPGAGHLILGKWVRALLLAAAILAMFIIGVALGGKLYSPNTGEPLDILGFLGFLGDLGAGLPFIIGRLSGLGQAPVLTAVADYGTKFISIVGLLNIVAAIDAHSIAIGRKPA